MDSPIIFRLTQALADRYRVDAELGAGGMATVYRAHDLKHGRDVAIKVLHPDLGAALGGERFLSEIRTTARLQHPHILPLLDSGVADGLLYYVMPLVTGESLRVRLERETRLPIPDVIRLAREIAGALEHAHRQGVVHRDIKPENILLQDDSAQVADFGIALAVQSAGGQRLTQTGLSLGTPQYMSPEQAMGERTIDARSDQYALAAVTYEMLTGEPPFTGNSVQAIVARVLSERPTPPHTLRDTVPVGMERAVLTGLSRLSADRYPNIEAFAAALESDPLATVPGRPIREAAAAGRIKWLLVTSALIIATGAVAFWSGRISAAPTERWTHFTQLTDASGVETTPSLAPDGEVFAYAGNAGGTYDLYVQRIGSSNPQLVAGDTLLDEMFPAWSPDGKSIAYVKRGDGIWVMGSSGENARRVTSFGSTPSWSPDGKRLVFGADDVIDPYNTNTLAGLWIVDVDGGAPIPLNTGDILSVHQPSWSPNGTRIAGFTARNGRRALFTVSAGGGDGRKLLDDASLSWAPQWSNDGRWLYFASDREGSMGLWRVGIDETTGEMRSPPELVAAGGDAWFDTPQISRDGRRLLFRSKLESINPAAVAVDFDRGELGTARLLQHRTGQLTPTDVSRDGAWLALNNVTEDAPDVWVMRTDGRDLRRVIHDDWRDVSPHFTPDGRALVFHSNRGGHIQAHRVNVDGSDLSPLTPDTTASSFPRVSPDGSQLLVSLYDGSSVALPGPWPRRLSEGKTFGPFRLGDDIAELLDWSPDGTRISGYIDKRGGDIRGHVSFDVTTGKITELNRDSETYTAAWLPDSRRLAYFLSDNRIAVQDVVTRERRVLRGRLPWLADIQGYLMISPDGRSLYYGARQLEANLWMVERDTR